MTNQLPTIYQWACFVVGFVAVGILPYYAATAFQWITEPVTRVR